ncbi:MAG: hypothetical protein QM572_11890 [Nocardioides sp.]|uniref:hypothetical protein n=1 Tax=Nocardioides sp. TaxID=35761 RepID=UPI0039E4F461
MAAILNPPLGIGWDRARGWHDQYARMVRWHGRLLREIAHEAEHGDWATWPNDLWDTAMAFFQSAFHLKDWIVRDHPELQRPLNAAIAAHPRLALCADICNGTKHGHVDRNHRTGAHATGLREFAPDVPSHARWLVLGPEGPINLDVLANDVLDAWESLLRRDLT